MSAFSHQSGDRDFKQNSLPRRDFLTAAGGSLLALSTTRKAIASASDQPAKTYRKAVKLGMVKIEGTTADKFKLLKELGFDGVEVDSPGLPVAEVLQAQDASGLPVHGVVDSVHWRDRLSDADPQTRAKGLAGLRTAIREAHELGATSVLLVPGRVTHDATYQEAWDRSQAEIKKALPLAEELGIQILLENVWNDFLNSPQETARYIDQLESPKMGAYFDVGNAVRYFPPAQWIPILGKRIKKLDIKEYSLEKARSGQVYDGFNVPLLEGDCDWPAVMSALRDIGYEGWGTAEIPGGGRERLATIAQRMDRIFAS